MSAEGRNLPLNLIGSETREILNVMRRCDPMYCQAYQQEPCMDQEWDAALQAAEDELNRLGVPPHPEPP